MVCPLFNITSVHLPERNSNEDKLPIEDVSKAVGKSKSVIHSILRKLWKPRNYWAGLGKLLRRKVDGLVMNQKKNRFATAAALKSEC